MLYYARIQIILFIYQGVLIMTQAYLVNTCIDHLRIGDLVADQHSNEIRGTVTKLSIDKDDLNGLILIELSDGAGILATNKDTLPTVNFA